MKRAKFFIFSIILSLSIVSAGLYAVGKFSNSEKNGNLNVIENTIPFDFKEAPKLEQKIFDETEKETINLNYENHLRATFTTSFATSSYNRKHNIQNAARKLNIVLYPDEIFSFNAIVGERTQENGFLLAPIILDGQFVQGVGGGVCQVSTTLYNCALLADLEIIHAQQHSMTVGYVSASFDAMVSSKNDLIFVNSTASPIRIKAAATDSAITVSIYGELMTRSVERRSVVLKTFSYGVEETLDNTLPIGTSKVLQRGKCGLSSKGYLDIYENNKLIVSKLIRIDRYKAQNMVVARGTKHVSEFPEPEVEG